MAGKHRANREADAAGDPQQAYAPPPQAAPAAAPSGALSPDAVEQLKSLAELHDQGVLTDQEFDEQKAKVLGR